MIKATIYLLGLCALAVIAMIAALILCFSNISWGEYADKGQELAKKRIAEAVNSAIEEGEKAAERHLDTARDDRPSPPPPAGSGVSAAEGRPGPAAGEPVRPAAEEEPGGNGGPRRYHLVRKGETLFSIARNYYGQGRRWRRIARANGIGDPSQIRIGARLEIPGAD